MLFCNTEFGAGMLDVVDSDDVESIREHAGFFAVAKENGRQRLVIDCRRSS